MTATELMLYITPGNISKLAIVRRGQRLPHFDLVTPPSPAQIGQALTDHSLADKLERPVAPEGLAWRVPIDEKLFEWGQDRPADRRRVRVLIPGGLEFPSKAWIAEAVDRMIYTYT